MKQRFLAALYRYHAELPAGHADNTHCRVLKLADKPSCLGGEDKRDKRTVMG
jgi:hypothetical protein